MSRLRVWWPRASPFFGLALCLLMLLGALLGVYRPASITGVVNLNQARLMTAGVAPALVALPHNLDAGPWPEQGRADYQLDWPLALHYEDKAQARLALLVPRVGARFRVLLNGNELHQIGWRFPLDRLINATVQPNFVPLPAGLLTPRAQDNRLVIEVRGERMERSGLSPVQLGDQDLVLARHRLLERWQVTGNWLMVLIGALMAVMALFLWHYLGDRLFLLMALTAAIHMVRLLMVALEQPPLSYEVFFLVHRYAVTAYTACLCLTSENLFGFDLRRVRQAAYALLLVGLPWLLLAAYLRSALLQNLWAGILVVTAFGSLMLLARTSGWGRRLGPEPALVLLVALFTFMTGLRDFLVLQLGFPGDANIRWMVLGSLAFLSTLGWVLLRRALDSMREVERLNATLSLNVSEREIELRSAFERLRDSEHQSLLERERRRLMRDMHDGLGSQLVQALNLVRNSGTELKPDRVIAMLQQALEELRLMLDSLEPMDGDLPAILGTLRLRIGPSLEAASIELDWQVEETPPIADLDARGVMNLFRCVQEIFANVVKHSRASRVTVRTWATADGMIGLAIADDGIGSAAALAQGASGRGAGRGLNNIRSRAELIGANMRYYDAAPGLGIEFRFAPGAAHADSNADKNSRD